jgi:tellurite methyltransferase
MENTWDSYWENDANRSYWLQPDNAVVELIKKVSGPGVKEALDLGCGPGRHTLCLAEAGFNVTALDSSAAALAFLQNKASEKGIDMNLIQGDYAQDLFPPESFDFILAYNVLYHGTRTSFENAVHLNYRWLKPHGLFFFTCPTRQDAKFGNGEKVAPNTFKPLNSIHPGDVHYFAGEVDIQDFLKNFGEISLKTHEHYWDNQGVPQFSSYWQVLARK